MTFIKSIISDSNKILLKKYGPPAPELLISDQSSIRVAFLDTETTGIDRMNDHVIEIAVKVLCFEASSGKILSIEGSYESFNDPEEDISREITLLTGIENKMVDGKFIDWNEVDVLFQGVDIIIAHNASFDRACIDRFSSNSPSKVWACSISDIDWLERGFTSFKQELLCYWHGFYFDAHRAMNDVDALIHLLTFDTGHERPLLELIKNSNKSDFII